MAREVVLPQLGLSMDSGRIIEWLKETGDHVEAGEVLLEVEAGKATVEVEAVASGTLQIRLGPNAGDIPVGTTIGYILQEGEDLVEEPARPVAGEPPAAAHRERIGHEAVSPGGEPSGEGSAAEPGRPPSSPAARRRARELGVDWKQARGTGPRNRIKVRDVERLVRRRSGGPEPEPQEIEISPVARRLAETYGVDIARLASRHLGERLERGHVDEAIREAVSANAGLSEPRELAGPVRRPMSSLRRLIADRMSQSARTTAAVTLTTEAVASQLVGLRQRLKGDLEPDAPVPSYNVMLAKIVARALMDYPYMNSSLEEDTILYHQVANIGVAVDTGEGLVVPVLRDVQDKSLLALSREAEELLARASAGQALPAELEGGTFTITNLGVQNVDAFTPIINPPECAVLGVGRLRDRVVAEDGQPVIRTVMALSLTFDHRLVDGAPAARFLDRVRELVEFPYLWMMERA